LLCPANEVSGSFAEMKTFRHVGSLRASAHDPK
jgi:hypothetical protein